MIKCNWCGNSAQELYTCSTSHGETKLCDKCKEAFDNNKCRRCGSVIDELLSDKGLCFSCMQVNKESKARRREESISGLGIKMISDVEFTTKDYDQWTTMGKEFSPDDMKFHEMRHIWINVKLNAAGVYDFETIEENYNSIEILLDRNFSKLVNNKCRILICDDSAERRELARSGAVVIDSEAKVIILQA